MALRGLISESLNDDQHPETRSLYFMFGFPRTDEVFLCTGPWKWLSLSSGWFLCSHWTQGTQSENSEGFHHAQCNDDGDVSSRCAQAEWSDSSAHCSSAESNQLQLRDGMFLKLRPLRNNNAVEASATGSRAVAVPSERSVMIGALSAVARCVKSRGGGTHWRRCCRRRLWNVSVLGRIQTLFMSRASSANRLWIAAELWDYEL